MGIFEKFKEHVHLVESAHSESEASEAADKAIKAGILLGKKFIADYEFALGLDVLEEISPLLLARERYDELILMWSEITEIIRHQYSEDFAPARVYAAILWNYIASKTKKPGTINDSDFHLLKDLLDELHTVVTSEEFRNNPSIPWRKAEWLRDSAKIHWQCRRTNPALKLIHKSVDAFMECEDWSEAATSLAVCARFYDTMGKKEDAIKIANRIVETLYSKQVYRPEILLFANEILESNDAEVSPCL